MTTASTGSGFDKRWGGRFQWRYRTFGAGGRAVLLACVGVALTFSVASALAASAPSFAPPKQYVTGKGPISIAVGDLNGDGKPDLATANGTRTISVLFNSGGGRFRSPRGYAAGKKVSRIAVSDVNGDRRVDLVTLSSQTLSSQTVSVLQNVGGATFQRGRAYAVGKDAQSLVVADLNGDGRPDLIALAWEGDLLGGSAVNGVSVLLNRGDGSFKPRVFYAAAPGRPDLSVVVADVNGDRAPDIVTASAAVLLNRGDGSFRPSQDRPPYGHTMPDDSKDDTLATGDLNGDGLADLAVASYNNENSCCELGRRVSVFISRGDGSFRWQVDYRTDRGPESVAIADMNGDRKPDIVTANEAGTFSLLLGRGDGTFRPALRYRIGTKPFSATYSLAVGDLNGDGRLDMVSANKAWESGKQADGTVSVLFARK